jgi:hypothetical protein
MYDPIRHDELRFGEYLELFLRNCSLKELNERLSLMDSNNAELVLQRLCRFISIRHSGKSTQRLPLDYFSATAKFAKIKFRKIRYGYRTNGRTGARMSDVKTSSSKSLRRDCVCFRYHSAKFTFAVNRTLASTLVAECAYSLTYLTPAELAKYDLP